MYDSEKSCPVCRRGYLQPRYKRICNKCGGAIERDGICYSCPDATPETYMAFVCPYCFAKV